MKLETEFIDPQKMIVEVNDNLRWCPGYGKDCKSQTIRPAGIKPSNWEERAVKFPFQMNLLCRNHHLEVTLGLFVL